MTGESTFEVSGPAGVLAGWRAGSGPPVLLLHGGPGLSDYLGGLAEELSSGYEVFRFQQRGLEPSTTSGPFSVEAHLADTTAVMDHIGARPLMVVGHSWGGHLAMFLAQEHSDRLAGAVIVDPLGAVGDGGEADLAASITERISAEDLGRAGELDARATRGEITAGELFEYLGLIWPAYFAEPAKAPPMPDVRLSLPCQSQTWDSIRAHYEGRTLETGLPDVKLPFVFVLGERSPIPPKHGQASAALVSGARVQIYGGCGHFVWIDQPGAVRAAVDMVAAGW